MPLGTPTSAHARDGLVRRCLDDAVECVRTRSGAMGLLLAEPGLEVAEGELRAGGRMTLIPPGEEDGVEAWYLLAGTLAEEAEGIRRYGAGDLLTAAAIGREVILTAVDDVRFLYLATRPQFHAMSRSMRELMELAVEVEKKDGYTADHCLHLLDYGAYLHDVGKVRVPVEILQKPGKLDAEEWEVIRGHPTFGRELVAGTFLARAIVDTFDAMTTDRPYRAALPTSVALAEIDRLAGVHWPAEYVRAFRSALPSVEPAVPSPPSPRGGMPRTMPPASPSGSRSGSSATSSSRSRRVPTSWSPPPRASRFRTTTSTCASATSACLSTPSASATDVLGWRGPSRQARQHVGIDGSQLRIPPAEPRASKTHRIARLRAGDPRRGIPSSACRWHAQAPDPARRERAMRSSANPSRFHLVRRFGPSARA